MLLIRVLDLLSSQLGVNSADHKDITQAVPKTRLFCTYSLTCVSDTSATNGRCTVLIKDDIHKWETVNVLLHTDLNTIS